MKDSLSVRRVRGTRRSRATNGVANNSVSFDMFTILRDKTSNVTEVSSVSPSVSPTSVSPRNLSSNLVCSSLADEIISILCGVRDKAPTSDIGKESSMSYPNVESINEMGLPGNNATSIAHDIMAANIDPSLANDTMAILRGVKAPSVRRVRGHRCSRATNGVANKNVALDMLTILRDKAPSLNIQEEASSSPGSFEIAPNNEMSLPVSSIGKHSLLSSEVGPNAMVSRSVADLSMIWCCYR